MNRLFLVVRADIPPGLQASQLVHASCEFAFERPSEYAQWFKESKNVVLLQVPDEPTLIELWQRVKSFGLEASAGFREPDLSDELTAVAFGDEAQRYLSSLPLALRDYAVQLRHVARRPNAERPHTGAPGGPA